VGRANVRLGVREGARYTFRRLVPDDAAPMSSLSPAEPTGFHAAVSPDDYRRFIDSVADYALFLLDPQGRVLSWNAGAQRIKGYEPHEIIGQHFSRFYTAEDIAAGKPDQELEAARALGHVEEEGWRVRKDGSLFWANGVVTALYDDDGTLRGYGEVTRDLSERRASEEALRRAEQRFHHLVDAVADYSIFMLDPTGHVATWNPGARKTKGYEASEIVGKHFSTFYTSEDRAKGRPEQILETVRREGRFEEEGWRVRKDGTRFWASVVISVLRDESGQSLGFAKVTRDLTARRAAEQTARELVREQAARALAESMARRAEEANRIKDEFLATVSHELRTPLNAIVGWTAILRQRELEPSVGKAVEVIDRNAQAQVKIIEDILDVSRIITGKLRIEPKPTDLVPIVNQAIEVTRHSAFARQISLDFPQATESCPLVGDPERLQQVVWNLISNAIKFTSPGGSVRIGLECVSEQVTLTVSDTGMGIEPEFLPFLFDRFRQGDSSTTRRFGGLGLGLALVRHITELHGGTVEASSAGRGHGASIKVTFPVRALQPEAEAEAAPESVHAAPAPVALEGLAGVRLLLVEDDPDARELMAAILREAEVDVKSVCSALAALDAFPSFRPQLLVSDIGLPEQDGYSLIRHVRALGEDQGGGIPALALTAYTRPADRTKALAAGFTTHVGKPVNPVDLLAALANLAAFVRR
jgi:PAS domain S-box-containing protein